MLGILSLLLGVIGIILPILPTTPFILLSLFLFSKGSIRFHNWFIATKFYKRYLKSFVEKREMTKKQKWRLMIFVDLMLLIPFIMINIWYVRVLIIVIDLGKYYYFSKVNIIELKKENTFA